MGWPAKCFRPGIAARFLPCFCPLPARCRLLSCGSASRESAKGAMMAALAMAIPMTAVSIMAWREESGWENPGKVFRVRGVDKGFSLELRQVLNGVQNFLNVFRRAKVDVQRAQRHCSRGEKFRCSCSCLYTPDWPGYRRAIMASLLIAFGAAKNTHDLKGILRVAVQVVHGDAIAHRKGRFYRPALWKSAPHRNRPAGCAGLLPAYRCHSKSFALSSEFSVTV